MANGSFLNPKAVAFYSLREDDRYDQPVDASHSSWRDMHLTDPPITTCVLHAHNGNRSRTGLHAIPVAIRDHGGLTLGLVYDTILAVLRSSARGSLPSKCMRLATFYTAFE
jgi:hypothetical protein